MYKKIIMLVLMTGFLNADVLPAMGRKESSDKKDTQVVAEAPDLNETESADNNSDEEDKIKATSKDEDFDEKTDGDFIYVEGDVSIRKPGSDEWEQVTGDTKLEKGAEIKLESDSYATVKVGSKKEIDLNEDTRFEYSGENNKDEIDMFYGSMKARVEDLGDEEMDIRTPVAVAAVRGTDFAVLYEEEDISEVEVYDGKVAVSQEDKDDGEGIAVTKDNWAQVRAGKRPELKGKITEMRKLRWKHLKNKRQLFKNARDLKRLKIRETRLKQRIKVTRDEQKKKDLEETLNDIQDKRKKAEENVKASKEKNKKLADEYKKLRKKNMKSRIDLIKKQRKELIKKRLDKRKEQLKNRRDRRR